jgi:hypothetical protein
MLKWLLIPLLALWPVQGLATGVRSLSIEYKHFVGKTIFPEMPNYVAKEGLALSFNTDLVGPLYWNNRIHSMTDSGQYRLVGWQFELGVRATDYLPKAWDGLELFYGHHSQHILDGHHPLVKFPVDNAVGFRWTIIKDDK